MKCIITLSVFLVIQISIFAQTLPYNQEFQVNTYTYQNQSNTKTAVLTSGALVITWDSWEHLGIYRGVYAQMYDVNGLKIGTEIHVNTYQDNEQIKPKIAALTNGGFVICWESNNQDSLGGGDFGWGVFAQIFDENGMKIGEEFQVNTTTYGGQLNPEIVAFTSGDFAICWETFVGGYNCTAGIFAQFFNSNGSRRGGELFVNTTQLEGYGITKPMLTDINSGNVVICWANRSQNNNVNGIYAQIFDQNGLKIVSETKVTTDNLYEHLSPEIVALPDGGFAIASNNEYGYGVLVNKFDSLGNRIGEQSLIDVDERDMNQQIAGFSDGRYIVTWQSSDWTLDFDVYAQLFDENGNEIGSIFRVNSYFTDSQSGPKISVLLNGNFIISWTSEVSPNGSGFGVFAQMYDMNGDKKGREFQVNSYANDNSRSPIITSLSEIGFIILWQSPDGSGYGIFGKYFLNEPIEHQLTEFNLLSPQNNETVYLTNPQFVWEKASDTRICFPWEIEYELYVSTNENFNNPIIKTGIEDTTTDAVVLTPGTNYYWKVVAKNIAGNSLWCSNVYHLYVDPNAVSVVDEENNQLPVEFNLSQNYPNPFNPSTKISWQSPVSGWQTLKVYDVLGNEVATLVNEYRPAGSYEIEFNPSSINHHPSSGIYFYRLQAGDYIESKKMILLK